VRTGARRATKAAALQLLRLGAPGRTVALLGYSVKPRGRGENQAVRALFDARRSSYVEFLAALPDTGATTPDPLWMLPEDARVLSGIASQLRPRIYMEIGSGASTAIVAGVLPPASVIVSIDPEPRLSVGVRCEPIRQRLEDVDLGVFDRLCHGDLLFCDGSHFAFSGSDASVFLLEVLPRLAGGVLVGIHDIHLPVDYPDEVAAEWVGEQQLVAAWLLGGGIDQVVLPAAYLGAGLTFWLRTAGR
jgi:hypothetical protein